MGESMVDSIGGGGGGGGGGRLEHGGSFTPKLRSFETVLERQRRTAARQQKARVKAKAARKARKRQRAAR
jgi:hypothetical protein